MPIYTIYTAVGHLHLKKGRGGIRCPVIQVSQKEHMVNLPEMLLWSRLCWRMRNLRQLRSDYASAAEEIAAPVSVPVHPYFDDTLARLSAQGLVVAGQGDTEAEALYDLLCNLYIVPISSNLPERLGAAAKLVLRRRISSSDTKRLLRRDRPTEEERHILSLARQALLSTAEIIRCKELRISDVSSSEKLLTALYDDDQTTCYNIGHFMSSSPKRDAVILAISNLYLRKQIIFQRINL